MKYSKKVILMAGKYGVSAEDIAFAILMANDYTAETAYAHAYFAPPKNADALKKKVGNAKIKKIINDLQVTMGAPTNQIKEEDISIGWDDNKDTSANLAGILKTGISTLDGEAKMRWAVQYAKLVGFDIEDKDTIHYYLPISCSQCPYAKDEE